jgi:glycosyltransferase involved in cell wall biosynthesis
MKILHVIPSLEIGGAQKLITDLLPILILKNIEVSLLVFNKTDNDYEKIISSHGIKIFTLSQKKYLSPLIIFKLLKYLKEYDIIHAHLFPAIYWVGFSGFLLSKPIIYTEHSTYNRRRNFLYLRFIEILFYKFYNKIISISDETQSNLKLWLCAKKMDNRFTVITNGVNLSKFIFSNNKMFSKSYKINVLMISRFNNSKDHETVIRSINYIENKLVHFIFVGDGPNKFKCEKLVLTLNIKDRVTFLGNRIDIPQLINDSYIGIQSSNWEGFGLSAVEFIVSGKPVIASNINALKQVVGDCGLLFKKGDEKELANHINMLIDNRYLYLSFSKKCIERRNDFDISKMANDYMKIYQNLI